MYIIDRTEQTGGDPTGSCVAGGSPVYGVPRNNNLHIQAAATIAMRYFSTAKSVSIQ